MRSEDHGLLTSLVLTTGNIKASNAPFNMWTCSLKTIKMTDIKNTYKVTCYLPNLCKPF